VSFAAVTCHACPVKELCTKREKNKGRNLTLSPEPVHEARERRRAEQRAPPFRSAMRCGQASKAVKDAAAGDSHRVRHQLGSHSSDAATNTTRTLVPT
jgi:Transposase DDE domain